MRVAELRALLANFPEDAEVLLPGQHNEQTLEPVNERMFEAAKVCVRRHATGDIAERWLPGSAKENAEKAQAVVWYYGNV